VDRIRSTAPSSRVVLLNVPNLGALPFLAGSSLEHRQAAQRLSVGMSQSGVNPLRGSTVAVVDLLCDSRFYQPAIFSSDGFHPSDAGYALMAEEVVRAYTTTSYPAPRSTCPEAAIVP
jgi:lysophospholipase L1-like esterase